MTGSRLAAIALIILPIPASAQVPVQIVELSNFHYAPQVMRLQAGKPITLSFVNRAKGAHDFTAKAFFERSRFIAGSAPGGEIELKSGQTRQVTLVPSAGTYKVHCGHFMHKQFGMTGSIVVQ